MACVVPSVRTGGMQSQYRFPPIPPAFWGRALWPVVVGIFAAGLVLLRQTGFGPGLTADSAIYVATGRNLFAGEGFVSVFGPVERYPPLYPLVIAATGFLHDDMIASAAVLNAGAFGLSVSATAAWLQTRQASAFLVVWVGLALALSPLASAATYVWSESVFVLFALLALIALDRFLVADTRRALLLSAVAAALCCLTRYAGAAVIACAVLLIALRRSWQPTRRLRAVVVYTAVGLAPTALWMARNVFVVGLLMGDRTQFHGSPLGTSHMVVEMSLALAVGPAVFDWIEAFSAGGGTRDATIADLRWKSTWLLGVWVLVVCGLVCGRRPGLWRDVSVPAGFLLCYFALLVMAPAAGGTIAEPRYVVPLIAPMLVVFALTLHACHARMSLTTAGWSGRRVPSGWGRGAWRRWPIPALASLWLAQWVAPNAAEIKQWLTHGGDGYGARRWAELVAAHGDGILFQQGAEEDGNDTVTRLSTTTSNPVGACGVRSWPVFTTWTFRSPQGAFGRAARVLPPRRCRAMPSQKSAPANGRSGERFGVPDLSRRRYLPTATAIDNTNIVATAHRTPDFAEVPTPAPHSPHANPRRPWRRASAADRPASRSAALGQATLAAAGRLPQRHGDADIR